MDALALLCNLHADGPLTLQRLRRLGCESIDALLELEGAAVAHALAPTTVATGAAPTVVVDRFRREATLLALRLEDGADEPADRRAGNDTAWPEDVIVRAQVDDDGEITIAELVGDERVDDGDSLASDDDEPDLDADALLDAKVDARFSRVGGDGGAARDNAAHVDEVLAAWRSLDDATPPQSPTRYEIPRPTADPLENRALEETELDGLSPELAQRLAEVGVLSLRGLIDASPAELARRIPLAFTRVKRLQLVARRALAALPPALPTEAPASLSNDAIDTSGPFA